MKSVAEFDIFPDGVTNWEADHPRWREMLEASVEFGVVWPAGYYATAINFDSTLSGSQMHFEPGAVIGGVFHLISDSSVSNYKIVNIWRSSNVVSVQTEAAHGYSTDQKVQIRHVHCSGTGAVDFNVIDQPITVTGSTYFTFPQVGPNATGSLMTASSVNKTPIRDVRVTGLLTTTDRLGTINAKDCYIERCRVMNDPTRHSSMPGMPSRGAHFYVGTYGLRMDELTIDYAAGDNTAAAFAVDGYGWNPSNCKFGFVHIKDSAYTGAYITGFGHTFGELRIDGFAKEAPNGEVLQDSNGSTQCAQMKGLWVNRCWDTRIDVLRTSQKTSEGTRAFDKYHALIDETGHSFYNSRYNGVSIGSWYASNVRKSGIAIADTSTYNSAVCNLKIEYLQIQPDKSGVTAGEYLLRLNPATIKPNVAIDSLRICGTLGVQNLSVDSTVNYEVGSYLAL